MLELNFEHMQMRSWALYMIKKLKHGHVDGDQNLMGATGMAALAHNDVEGADVMIRQLLVITTLPSLWWEWIKNLAPPGSRKPCSTETSYSQSKAANQNYWGQHLSTKIQGPKGIRA
jgi:hypothetical protein